MTTKQQNYISMTRSSVNVLQKRNSEWNAIPRFANEVSAVTAELQKVDSSSENAMLVTKGVTADKANAREEALSAIVNIAKPASVYADDINDLQLSARLNYSRGSLSTLAQNDLLNMLTGMYNNVFEHKDNIVEYGVTEEKLTDAKSKLDAFAGVISTPRDMIVERKTTNELIEESIGNLRKIFYRLDNLMKLFEGTPFYAEYKNARIIVDLGSRKTQGIEDTLPPVAE